MTACLKFRLYTFLFLLVNSLFFSCAEVAGPSGGPRDETAPTIISTIPLSGNVNTLTDNKITIAFSEGINTKGVEETIFITPRPDGKLKYSWKKNRLAITLPESFKSNTTYVVTVGSGVRDLRGNKLEESFSFAFSTGETIDDGSVGGLVFQENKLTAGVTLGLFDYSILDSFIFLDSLYPPYITQSGKNGEFEFNYLPDGKYLVLAYGDKNKNQLLNYPSEMFGLPDRFVVLDSIKQARNLNITMTSVDTTSLSIISTTFSQNNLVKARLSKSIKSETVFEFIKDITLTSLDREDSLIMASSVKESNNGETAILNLYFANLVDGLYKLRIGERLLAAVSSDSTYIEGSEFPIQLNSDSTAPQIDYFSSNQKTIFLDENNFEIGFSEPMSQILSEDSSILIYDNDDILKDISLNWIDDFRLGLRLDKPDWGKDYFVVLDENKYFDLTGNSAGDSISVFKFNTYDSDSLGEATGQIEYGLQIDSNVVSFLTFSEVSNKKRFSKKVSDNHFTFNLPPGKYLLSGFIDANNNGSYDSGSLFPFGLAETMAIGADTIRVRARFETAGLIFKFE